MVQTPVLDITGPDRMNAEITRRVMAYRQGLMGTRSVFAPSEDATKVYTGMD